MHRSRIVGVACVVVAWCLAIVGARAQSDSCMANFARSKRLRLTHNNSVVMLPTGQDKFDDLFEAVRQARHSIHLEYFNFRNDSITGVLFDLLATKAAEGVTVRALFDAFGNISNNKPLTKKHVESLRKRGIEIYEFDPLRFPWLNHVLSRDHRKIVVIDGMVAYTGGMNVADYYIHGKPEIGSWRDLHFRVSGHVVGQMQSIFLRIWNKVTGQSICGPQYYPGEKSVEDYFAFTRHGSDSAPNATTIAVVNREPEISPKIVRETFLASINCAERKIRIINPYFTLNGPIKKALERAAERGVDVQIMVSTRSDIPITPDIVDYTVHKLMQHGVQVYYYTEGFHHTKMLTVDDNVAYVGSANLNSRSLRYDYECNMLIIDHYLTQKLDQLFEHEKQSSFVLTEEIWKKQSRGKRFRGWFFHFLRPFVQSPAPSSVPYAASPDHDFAENAYPQYARH